GPFRGESRAGSGQAIDFDFPDGLSGVPAWAAIRGVHNPRIGRVLPVAGGDGPQWFRRSGGP
ncbi:hypothetical protein, partial [Escherichia coli]|uniref:hypothetical protein n=1 Tax=Escherichia coli TaxID=562 RepID=UPI001BE42C61